MRKKGKLIVFEGLDYSFKETNSTKLYEYIKTNITEKVILLSFPNYKSESSIFIKKYLSGEYGEASKLDPYITSLFYALDRYDTINDLKIKEKLNENYIIILDRYIYSNIMYQSTKLSDKEDIEKFIKFSINLEHKILDLPKVDIGIYMNMPVDVSYELMKERKLKSEGDKDGHEDNYEFMKSVERNGLSLMKRAGYNIINCINPDKTIKSEDEIFKDILDIFNRDLILSQY